MIHPDQVADMLLATLTAAAATGTATPGPVKPIPTVIPTPTEWQVAGKAGHQTLWVVFALMTLSSAAFAALSWRVPVSRRAYHVLTTLAAVVSALAYFAMASGRGGRSFHCERATDAHDKVPDTSHLVCREVHWARSADWALSTPLLLIDLCLLAGVDGARTLMAVAADLVVAFAAASAAVGRAGTPQRWGWLTIAVLAYLVVVWHVGLHGARGARVKGRKVARLFGGLGLFTLVVWTAYPIVWGVARKGSVNTEIIAFAVLDVLAKAVFGFWLLLAQRSTPEASVEIGGYWSHGLASEGTIRLADDEA